MTDATEPIARDEAALADPDPAVRAAALERLAGAARTGAIELPPAGNAVNLHCHTFFSYNPYGYSPSEFAWRARRRGLAAAGIVDFDVLDGVDEFLAAGRLLALRTCAGLETRVFVPEFADRVINSPGEPGIAYHMGVGFPRGRVPAAQQTFLAHLKAMAQARNRGLVERVNAFLDPVTLDLDRDVLPLTPAGNATERHLCAAYARRAAERYPDPAERTRYWTEKLGADAAGLDLPEGPKLQAQLRARTMKRGGAGYVAPDRGSFPTLADTNRFLFASGAIPTVTWLDGTSEGERAMPELLDTAEASGAAALNIIPDRNFTPGVEDEKLRNLRAVVAMAEARHWPVFVGTEMNSPGNRFVDDFGSAELAPLLPVFLRGARIAYAHTRLQSAAGLGYTSDWARERLADRAERNAFFERVGAALAPDATDPADLLPDPDPAAVLRRIA